MVAYRLLADLVVIVHAAFVGFVVGGLAVILVGAALGWEGVRNAWFRLLHLVAIAVVATQALAGVICPLTLLENALRRRAGQATYPGAFLGYWVHEVLFLSAPAWVFTLTYSLFALAVLAAFVLVPPRRPRFRR